MIVALVAFVVIVVAAVHQFNCNDLRQTLLSHCYHVMAFFFVIVDAGTAVAGVKVHH